MLVTYALVQAPPAHIHNFPPRHKALADVKEVKVPTEKPEPKPAVKTATKAATQTEKPKPVTAKVSPARYMGTGDWYLDYIVQKESSGNPYAINSIGACGLFQALPCSKLNCYLRDVQCQINWGRNYAIERYGSTRDAYLFWINHNWW